MQVYFDNAATTLVYPEVIDSMSSVLKEQFGNPSSTHAFGRSAKNKLESSRKKIAALVGVKASEIVFTSGGTEADNLILQSAVRDLGVRHIITTKIEHHAVLYTIQSLQKHRGIRVSYVPVLSDGQIDDSEFEKTLKDSKERTLVSLMHINNEMGKILDLQKIGNLCEQYGALFHSDMVQSFGHYAINLNEFPVDFAAASAHKFHGPKGIGFAYIKKGSGIKPLILGGEQERGCRGGTEGVHNVVGMALALEMALQSLQEDRKKIQNLKNYFVEQLRSLSAGVIFNADSDSLTRNTYTLLSVRLPVTSKEASMLLFKLDIAGIACSKGSACQSGSTGKSHVLQEFLPEVELQKPSIRFSFSKFNTIEEVDYVIKILKELL